MRRKWPTETHSELRVAGDEKSAGEDAVVASHKQRFTGLRMGLPSLEVRYNSCNAQVGEGDQVSVYAYRAVETPRWHLARYQYTDCAPGEITTPTLGATEARISARLAVVSDVRTQQHRLCLAEPTVSAVASPQNGTPP